MSIWGTVQAINYVWDNRGLTPGEKLVALVLADDHPDAEDVEGLVDRTGMNRAQVTRALGGLKKSEFYERLMENRWGDWEA